MSDEGTVEITRGEVVADFALREGQTLDKIYTNCSPLTMLDEPGRYKIVRVGYDE